MMREYAEEHELGRYVWKNYSHALTDCEQATHIAVVLKLKATNPSFEPVVARYCERHSLGVEVATFANRGLKGLHAFEKKCCGRLLREHGSQIYINRCERCHRIVATPVACVCLWCGHHGYDRRAEMIVRAKSSIYPNSDAVQPLVERLSSQSL